MRLFLLIIVLTTVLLSSVRAQEVTSDTLDLFSMSFEDLMAIEVISASQIAEPLSEAPVPLTVITEDLIRRSGSKNLRDLLALYVPGMTIVQDHNEYNIAMRGIYASSQQKILIMLDGHRLNSRSYSSANPDYSIGLEKIERIEILRGPASSLYGNVALTAVVNIVLKTTTKEQEGSVTFGFGSYGQRKSSLLYNASPSEKSQMLFWGNFYQSSGQTFALTASQDYSANPKDGEAIVDGFKDMPSYDVGMRIKNGKFSFMGNIRQSKYIEPFSGGGVTGEIYDYKAYRTIMGTGPGLSSGFAHSDMKYEYLSEKGFGFTANMYADYASIMGTIVLNPAVGAFGAPTWKEYSYGSIVQANKTYELAGRGNVLAGIQYDYMYVFDSYFPTGTAGDYTSFADKKDNPLLMSGGESITSAFFQLKHHFNEQWLLNVGMRFDDKNRLLGDNILNISPRLALIYMPSDNLNFKLSYATSFVDAPYWYRYNSLASYKGSQGLLPERLKSLQLTPSFSFLENRIHYTLNAFYNQLTDFIYRDLTATGDEPRYRNAGELTSMGLENEVSVQFKYLNIRAQATYQNALSAKDYGVTDNEIHNIPSFSSGLDFDVMPFPDTFEELSLNINYRYVGAQAAPILAKFQNGLPFEGLDHRLPAVGLINAGARIDRWKYASFDARVYNLFDKQYSQGGSTLFPYMQAGRWYTVTLGLVF